MLLILTVLLPHLRWVPFILLWRDLFRLSQLDHPASKVFCVFEKEEDKRQVLSSLTTGYLDTVNNDSSGLSDPKFLFRGKHVLRVTQPDQPSTIRWQDLNARLGKRIQQQLLTFFLTAGLIVVVAWIIASLNEIHPIMATLGIATANLCFPEVC